MSIKIMTKVWEHAPYRQTDLLILLAMADFADDDGKCWPNQETLAAKARCTVETIRTRTKAMIEAGHLEVLTEASSHRSKRYLLTPNLLGENALPPNSTVFTPKSDESLPPNLEVFSPKSAWGEPLEPSEELEPLEPSEGLFAQNAILIAESQQLRVQHDKAMLDDKFNILWDTFDNKRGKQQARKAFDKAVKDGVNPDTLIAMAFRYSKWLDLPGADLQCHLSTWINQERWKEDDYDTPPRVRGSNMTTGQVREQARLQVVRDYMDDPRNNPTKEIEQ